MNEPKLKQLVDLQCGDGAAEYIIRIVQIFVSKKATDSNTSRKGEK